ncbi:ABC transporter permease [Vibrio vulnificus]|uniref:ABC transporter permease n=1 Tax=Vibrio vulnificus TaxID=672 RepID=UPI0024DF6893|nr:ABC transporter permease [Vibrio vulnificus]EHI9241247.1 ABC transporter permease [Vibrio vulnificus]MDK2608488.1 ABC transporter permease [Vibrio vulnificus]MDK2613785.1 ABC transporter permease [Vibrio vulnificus]MDK2631380.1 ABC transporter permease [Vibrio vulnificus]MDK2706796.1 ABC transporter permease [Vibrio vulnificus]
MKTNCLFKNKAVRELSRIFTVVLSAILIGFIITLFISEDAIGAFKVLLTGPFPKVSFIDGALHLRGMSRTGSWLIDFTTLTLLGLSVCLAFRAQQFSMGAEGQLFLGALVSACVAIYIDGPSFFVIPLALIAAATVGFLWGLIPGYLKAYLNANEIVSTLMLNAIAVQLYRYVLVYYMNDPSAGYIASQTIPEAARLSYILDGTRLTSMFYIMVAAVALVILLVYRSKFGYQLNIIGINERFAKYGGIATKRIVMLTFAVSGVFAGLAGAHMALGVTNRLNLYLAPGIGFEGIVVALLARNDPRLIPLCALLYSYLRVGSQIMERSTDVPREIVLIIQALIILFVMVEHIKPFAIRLLNKFKSNKTKVITQYENKGV